MLCRLGPKLLQASLQTVGEKDSVGTLFDERVSVRGSTPVGRQISRF